MSDVDDALRRATYMIPSMVPEGVRVPAVDRQILAAEVLSLRRGTALLVKEHNREIQELQGELARLRGLIPSIDFALTVLDDREADELARRRRQPRERPGRIDLGDDPDGDNS